MDRIINWLYSKGDNCSDFQKELRVYMWSKHMMEKIKGIKSANDYKLSKRENKLLDRVTN